MQKLKDFYNNLSIENKARTEGALAVVIVYIAIKLVAYFL